MGNRWGTARTEAFSDGVLAIAITLLVLDISVPSADFEHLGRGILDQWPAYLAYVTSFLTIGALWLAHHGIFTRLRFVDRRVMRFNLLLLMTASFVPFPTRLMAEAIRDTTAERVAVIFYGAVLLVLQLLLAAMVKAAADRPDLHEEDVSALHMERMWRGTAPSLGFYLVAAAVALLTPRIAAVGYLVIAVQLVLRARGDEQG
ncbi:MAG TPA: TMEM175 family protein [Solirubrobacteraceae bacterium]